MEKKLLNSLENIGINLVLGDKMKKQHGALKNFVSIVPVFHSDERGCEDILVMAGDFNADELYKANNLVHDWSQKHNE